jgi:hypothetical protein
MTTPPEPVLEAALYALHWALVYSRNLTGQPSVEAARQIHQLTDAIHPIPEMLITWPCTSIDDLRLYFACFDHRRWEGAPDLVGIFERKLAELTHMA